MSEALDPDLRVPWNNVTAFLRQLSHDLRNNLNAMELQAAFLAELAEDAEMKDEVKRLRAMASELGAALQKVTGLIARVQPHPMPYTANDFLEDVRSKIAGEFPEQEQRVIWSVTLTTEMLEIDPQLLLQAFTELFANAFRLGAKEGTIEVKAVAKEATLTVTIREPNPTFSGSTAEWGRTPLGKMAHGHYGLGLYRVRGILEAHQGSLHAEYDSAASVLVTTVTLPLLPAA